jgi:hypothetical protein
MEALRCNTLIPLFCTLIAQITPQKPYFSAHHRGDLITGV